MLTMIVIIIFFLYQISSLILFIVLSNPIMNIIMAKSFHTAIINCFIIVPGRRIAESKGIHLFFKQLF